MRWCETRLLLAPAAAALLGAAAPQTGAPASCTLTPEDKARNAAMSFGDFDQSSAAASTPRALAARGCYAAAAQAGEDYLARAPFESERLRTSVVFHMAQNLAMAGRTDAAAIAIVGARRSAAALSPGFDWNGYVTGTWAFLRGDRATLYVRRRALAVSPTHPDQTNAKVLGGLIACFDRPYREAYSPACAAKAR